MLDTPAATLTVPLAYLIGSVPFAVVTSRAMGLADPRSYGSKNPGATNVLRSGNKLAALLTLLGDALKGWLAIALAAHLCGQDANIIALSGLAAFLGHLFPIFLRFQGGKGVATAAGVLLGLHPLLGASTLLAWLAVAFITRYSSLAAVCAALYAPIAAVWLFGPSPTLVAVVIMSALLVWRHRGNLQRLREGTEGKLGASKKAG